ncbi:hypothetical protein [Flammeovirga aprica]|uniref:Uncharacterized protein n=1 Tax=Flammeovirga aprica JL-4 TaxID=694437 RepID=A0A7X9NZL3_9BACT|nr:hypothetical protein [Flammeovirga aprica]NME66851.1 hypothetical protein [Flammeovirga aprica JL-4]
MIKVKNYCLIFLALLCLGCENDIIDPVNSNYITINEDARFSMLHFKLSLEKLFNQKDEWQIRYDHEIVNGNITKSYISYPLFGGFADSVVSFTHNIKENGVIESSDVEVKAYEHPVYYRNYKPTTLKIKYFYNDEAKINQLQTHDSYGNNLTIDYLLENGKSYKGVSGYFYETKFFYISTDFDYYNFEPDTAGFLYDEKGRVLRFSGDIISGGGEVPRYTEYEYSGNKIKHYSYYSDDNKEECVRTVYKDSFSNFEGYEFKEWKTYFIDYPEDIFEDSIFFNSKIEEYDSNISKGESNVIYEVRNYHHFFEVKQIENEKIYSLIKEFYHNSNGEVEFIKYYMDKSRVVDSGYSDLYREIIFKDKDDNKVLSIDEVQLLYKGNNWEYVISEKELPHLVPYSLKFFH